MRLKIAFLQSVSLWASLSSSTICCWSIHLWPVSPKSITGAKLRKKQFESLRSRGLWRPDDPICPSQNQWIDTSDLSTPHRMKQQKCFQRPEQTSCLKQMMCPIILTYQITPLVSQLFSVLQGGKLEDQLTGFEAWQGWDVVFNIKPRDDFNFFFHS